MLAIGLAPIVRPSILIGDSRRIATTDLEQLQRYKRASISSFTPSFAPTLFAQSRATSNCNHNDNNFHTPTITQIINMAGTKADSSPLSKVTKLFSSKANVEDTSKQQAQPQTDGNESVKTTAAGQKESISPLKRTDEFIHRLDVRRSIYALDKKQILSDDELVSLIKRIVRTTPSAFNSQTSRVLILLGEHHSNHWSKRVVEALQKVMPEAEAMHKRAESFASAYGTVVFYEDQDAIKEWQEKQDPSIAQRFPTWSAESSGMAQVNTWTALEQAGYGANLQHYGPMVQESLAKDFNVPSSWKVHAELVFGNQIGQAKEKTYIDDANRFIVPSNSSA